MMSPHNIVTHVTSFPPAELPAFIGTMTPSDFPCSICLSPFIIGCPAYSLAQENRGPPGLPHIRNIRHAMVSDPGETPLTCHPPVDMLTSAMVTTSSLSTKLSRLNPFNLTAYGLPSRCPTLNLGDCSRRSKDSLPGGWPAFRGGHLTR